MKSGDLCVTNETKDRFCFFYEDGKRYHYIKDPEPVIFIEFLPMRRSAPVALVLSQHGRTLIYAEALTLI